MKAIFACDLDGGMGYNGDLPWPRLVGDLARFKEKTQCGTVIMGRGTYESKMPIPLPNRTNVVVSSSMGRATPGVILCKSIEDCLRFCSDSSWVIGGAMLLSNMWDMIDHVELTMVHGRFRCDTSFDIKLLHDNFECHGFNDVGTHVYQTWKRK